MSEVMTQDMIDGLLAAVSESEKELDKFDTCRKIRIYDFKRPDKFSKLELLDISGCFEDIAGAIKSFLYSEYDINSSIKVESTDQLTFEEFVHSTPLPSPSCTFDWLDGYGVLQISPSLFFKGVLSSKIKKNRNLNGLEKAVFVNYLYKPFMNIIKENFSKAARQSLNSLKNEDFLNDLFFSRKRGRPTDMGVLITLKAVISGAEGFLNFFLCADAVSSLRETKFFSDDEKSTVVPLEYPEPDTIVEVGKFRLEENFKLERKMIFELNKKAGMPLYVYKNGNYAGAGEAVVIDDNKAIRITSKTVDLSSSDSSDFYNVKVIYGSCISGKEEKFEEGTILELNEKYLENMKIVENEKVIASGELIVIGENLGIKISKIIQ